MDRRDFLATVPTVAVASQLHAEEKNASDKLAIGPNDWPWWRGPNRDGIAPAQKIPLEWSATKNVLWEAEVPGRGHGAAIVVGDRVFLATADEKAEVQGLLCLDRKSGKQLWHTEIHHGKFSKAGMNGKASHASMTPACDGERVYINFLNKDAVHRHSTSTASRWQTRSQTTPYTRVRFLARYLSFTVTRDRRQQGRWHCWLPDSTVPPASWSGAQATQTAELRLADYRVIDRRITSF